MKAVEFTTEVHHGTIKIPENCKEWDEKSVKVILLFSDEKVASKAKTQKNLRDFFEKIRINLKNYTFDRDEANER